MTRPASVLIVDDNPANAKLADIVLANAGYEVRTAADAATALQLLESFVPDVILMDLQLPGIDGFELTRMLKRSAATAQITVIALTAYAMKGDEQRARAAGCDGYIAKPMNTRTLADQVASFLPRRR